MSPKEVYILEDTNRPEIVNQINISYILYYILNKTIFSNKQTDKRSLESNTLWTNQTYASESWLEEPGGKSNCRDEISKEYNRED